ncbi:MAG: C10 family peptidase, partial [Bacteroidaceae bacterium]|nr:C10 family peptidase [Bacteroidaceae bacterium]
MKKLLLSIVLFSTAILSIAQQRTEAEAAAIAKTFMQNNGFKFNITKSTAPSKIRAKKAGEIVPYYIFNDTQKGGFVIVGGQEAMSDILAYSDEECFDIDNIPPAAAKWLEVYSQCAMIAADNPEKSKAEKRARAKAFAKSNFSTRQNIEPLLGEIKYNQGAPYNIKCPIFETRNGSKSNAYTGCTQTAQAMVMRYWKHPERPTGNKSYTFSRPDNTSQHMTLSIDFDEEKPYDWDNMLPRYEGHSYTDEQADAIATLMYHCGIANDAEYGLSVTLAAINYNGLVNYFGYADDIVIDSYTLYKDKANGDNLFLASLRDEITQRRPIIAGGWDNSGASHYYVIDGYDINNLLHFNLGWNGTSNGYYEVVPVPQVPYGYNMYICRHIHPEGRLTPTSPERNIVIEAGLGDFNEQTNNIKNTLKSLDSDKKYGESLICIVTTDTKDNAEHHLTGLGNIQGLLIDRCDTVTGTISATSIEGIYRERYNTDAPANIDIDAMFASKDSMKVSVSSHFVKNIENANYRYIFVYTENNVKIDGTTYNYVARGRYPNNYGYENSIPTNVQKDKEYIFEQKIPLPKSISNVNNVNLIVIMVDANNNEIVNANKVDLKQVNAWREKQKPSFFGNGKLLDSGMTFDTYSYDEEYKRMPFTVKLNNPIQEPMEITLTAKATKLGENAEVQLGDTVGTTTVIYSLPPLSVDSSMTLYLNIDDEFISSKSTVKLSVSYNGNIATEQIVNFNFIETADGINAFTVRTSGTLDKLVPQAAIDTITTIKVTGLLSGKDLMFIRQTLKASIIDLSEANIIKSSETYYSNNTTEDNVIGTRMFYKINARKIILPETVNKIGTYAFNNCENLTDITIGENVTSIANYAFKGCPIKYFICKGETPASASTNTFDSNTIANATLVVPTEAAIAAYKTARGWKNFGTIISYDKYITNITPTTMDAIVTVKEGKIIVEEGAEATIYTITGKLVARGNAGEYTLPAGNYTATVLSVPDGYVMPTVTTATLTEKATAATMTVPKYKEPEPV